MSAVPKPVHPRRIRENPAADDHRFVDDDIERIAGLDLHFRYVDPSFWVMAEWGQTAADMSGD